MNPAERTADLRGLVRLAADGVTGVTDVVEAVHRTIAERAVMRWLPLPRALPRLSALAYGGVRGTTALAAKGLEAALAVARLRPPSGPRPGAKPWWPR